MNRGPRHIDQVEPFLFPDAEADRLARVAAAKPQATKLKKADIKNTPEPEIFDRKKAASGERQDN